ncbi:TROVE domain-containing protein [Rapidithrix thailandica]|uniref:TROVE domain-containing protein n=1 Tax=Rapidithrix thailandica TaxID=413964 RepID=A0AAW9S6Q5_9BACT
MRFNKIKNSLQKITNYEGAAAYQLSPALELYTAVVTSSLSNQFYENAGDRLERIKSLIGKNEAEFVAKLATYTREKMHLRSIPLVLTVELAKQVNGNSLLSKTVDRVVQRADEITELLAYYTLANDRKDTKKLNKLSKQLQKGLAKSFNKFDEYQFAKYNRATEVKLRDALFLVHPKAKDEQQQALFNKITNDTLSVPYTWETELSALGQQAFANEQEKKAAFKAKWEELIDSKKLGYMALLRNLRNILEAGISTEHLVKVCMYLSDETAVKRSKQLPTRYLAAYRELKKLNHGHASVVLNALEDAVKVSVANMKGFGYDTRVLIACDVSGSMQQAISPKSKVLLYDIGLMLGMLLQYKCKNVISGMFGDRWKTIAMPSNNILSNVDEFYRREGEVGYSTNGYLVIRDLVKRKEVVDKVMLFTDCQLWDSNGYNQAASNQLQSQWKAYKKIAPQAKLYLFDLAGYGQVPLNVLRNDVHLIGGWSDKIFDVLQALEDGSNALAEIEKIEL